MSRPGDVSYEYQEDYYVDEELVEEYGEGEIVSQNRANVTELYRRSGQHQQQPPHASYDQPPQYHAGYYYDHVPQCRYTTVYDPKSGRYYRMLEHQENPMPPANYQLYAEAAVPVSSRKFPVTVKTPRYFKRSNALCKRPSALCLPVASQPDPASIQRRSKRCSGDQQHGSCSTTTAINEVKQQKSTVVTHKMDSEGDVNVNVKMGHLDTLLAKYEREAVGLETLQVTSNKRDIANMIKYIKPRVPLSIRLRQEKAKMKSLKTTEPPTEPNIISNTENVDMVPDSLEKLLNQLRKCEVGKTAKKPISDNEKKENINQPNIDEDVEEQKSFNYKEISQQLDKSSRNTSQLRIDSDTEMKRIQRNSIDKSSKNPPLDDHCALELHRSKSYIVNLIDKALSKELGTVPCERWPTKEYESMNAKKAIAAVNRHAMPTCSSSSSCKRDFCFELTNVLADSLISNATAPETADRAADASNKVCGCHAADEPAYIKQLKQLRWGHLKHIQREVRRLEDLERFLDACTSSSAEF